ncbi:hypothetical protein [Natronorubrum thiooxidans]|uniref:Uncharacterized protein n=1 Tax=Natronorubrum thiooxidans TaxID=308853 RepID=A0A1N7FAQ0_9EURY|nr:hypothetical protein [Natronorubrum thiooxidans]SIR97458.1 hypothetical protein SAMN05421752_106146 [Natronorubrum thiooxidans]
MRRGPGRDPGATPSGSQLTSSSAWIGVGFVLLVGLSGGMMALQGGASLAAIGVTMVGGLVAGGALLWYLYWITD